MTIPLQRHPSQFRLAPRRGYPTELVRDIDSANLYIEHTLADPQWALRCQEEADLPYKSDLLRDTQLLMNVSHRLCAYVDPRTLASYREACKRACDIATEYGEREIEAARAAKAHAFGLIEYFRGERFEQHFRASEQVANNQGIADSLERYIAEVDEATQVFCKRFSYESVGRRNLHPLLWDMCYGNGMLFERFGEPERNSRNAMRWDHIAKLIWAAEKASAERQMGDELTVEHDLDGDKVSRWLSRLEAQQCGIKLQLDFPEPDAGSVQFWRDQMQMLPDPAQQSLT